MYTSILHQEKGYTDTLTHLGSEMQRVEEGCPWKVIFSVYLAVEQS